MKSFSWNILFLNYTEVTDAWFVGYGIALYTYHSYKGANYFA